MMLQFLFTLCFFLLSCAPVSAAGFDHTLWNNLLNKHVVAINDGKVTEVDYRAMLQDRANLQSYLAQLSTVETTDFLQWSKAEQLAFLINAYNSWTVELILTRYPDLTSIKELGSFFQSPWKKKFIFLLGEKRSLDDIEHNLIREPGRYNEPRIHFAVNCASIGCPALRWEAYRGEILEQQLISAEKLFLSDQTRNRIVEGGVFEVSSIFSWYGDDFREWAGSAQSLEEYFLSKALMFSGYTDYYEKNSGRPVKIRYLEYDWRLNDITVK
ncbi:DUF547 domain-containing protein [Desulforhopalus sp. IMCC35007]|uniref:DUF547 domain-containing protein n=1 Tax=Desulforhopalus sp. IMCC35007 TaxID=2569543 RepID=UPI0010ADC234|nr:DUF547 domain-containing protein [Desulforhopalus sp. IMCC35007]TKB09993.1 DUF547 domain-containing protein [Desulforhopalus sp. IMCC35007]